MPTFPDYDGDLANPYYNNQVQHAHGLLDMWKPNNSGGTGSDSFNRGVEFEYLCNAYPKIVSPANKYSTC